MSDLFPISVPDMLAEVEREIALRRRVYPRLIAKGKLSQAKSDRQIAVLEALIEYLQSERAAA